MFLRNIKMWVVVAALSVGINVNGQDLLASQAPVDRTLRAIDSVALHRQIIREQMEHPGYGLYPSWDNERVHVYGDVKVPDTFRIDLRGFTMPTSSQKITSRYGYRRRFRRQHKGLDLKVYVGDTIYAAFDGKVRIVANQGRRVGYGKYVVLRHDNGLETIYGHLSKQLVTENEYVRSGQPIGLGGNTGRSTGSHLHFETRLLGQEINPELLFDFPNQDVTGDFYMYYSPAAKRRYAQQARARGEKLPADFDVRYHRVRSGDTLSKISHKYGVSIAVLCELNGIRKNSTLRIGQMLRYS